MEVHVAGKPDELHINARLYDKSTYAFLSISNILFAHIFYFRNTYYFLEGKEHIYMDIVLNEEHAEFRGISLHHFISYADHHSFSFSLGNFYGPGYPLFTGPGYSAYESSLLFL